MCLFFIFGVVPKDRVVRREMRYCPFCGRDTMHRIIERRMWFTLFFVPLFPVSGKQTVAICEDCGMPETARGRYEMPRAARVCPNCGNEVGERARFCENCGLPLG